MTQKLKLGLGFAGFILLLIAATVAYNRLSDREKPGGDIVLANEQGNVPNSAPEKQKAPDFSMTDIEGTRITLSGFIANGKPIVLNFWASWCPPCKVEMPEFDRVYQETGGEVRFIMLDLTDGQRETVQKGAQYVKEQGFSFPVYFDTAQEAAYAYGIRAIPTTLFIDKDGYIVTGTQGAINGQTLRRGIEMIRDGDR
jgi:thiol-disulfide isomerase/thioredoxin